MKLVEDAKQCWTWFSMQAMTLAGAVQGAWIYIPEDLRVGVPSNLIQFITITLLALGIIGRLFKQGKKDATIPPL